MKRLFSLFILTSLCATLCAQGDVCFNKISTEAQTSCNVGCSTQGVSAAFAGLVENRRLTSDANQPHEKFQMVTAGGSNFPTVPAHKGGRKKYYDVIMARQNGWWKLVGHLPQPLAYGASAQVAEGIVCLGGQDSTGVATKKVYLISSVMTADAVSTATRPGLTGEGETLIKELPDLPEAMAECAAAYDEGYIYVAGGKTSKFYRMAYPEGKWEELPPLPGPQRVQPCAVIQKDALGHHVFVLIGGYDPVSNTLPTHSLLYKIHLFFI